MNPAVPRQDQRKGTVNSRVGVYKSQRCQGGRWERAREDTNSVGGGTVGEGNIFSIMSPMTTSTKVRTGQVATMCYNRGLLMGRPAQRHPDHKGAQKHPVTHPQISLLGLTVNEPS